MALSSGFELTAKKTITNTIMTLLLITVSFFYGNAEAAQNIAPTGDLSNAMVAIYMCMGLFISCTLYSIFVAVDSGERSHYIMVLVP